MQVQIIEHDPLVRKLLEMFVDRFADMSGEEQADVILLDAREIDQIETLRMQNPEAKIAVMTDKPDIRYLKAACIAGVDGFWYQVPEADALHSFLLAVMAGEKPVPERTLIVKLGNTESCNITGREMEVLREIISGKTDAQIGEVLGMSIPTVKHHIQQLRLKTGLANRTQLAAEAVSCGLIDTKA